jgi:hypothetical protein
LKSLENLKKVSLIFFLVIGLAHIISGLLISNNQLLSISGPLNRYLDIPFAITGLIFGFASLTESFEENKRKTPAIIFGLITFLILVGLLYINILVPDKTSII